MVAITLRSEKGAPLTAAEVDTNFTNLKTAVEALTTGADGRGISAITASGSTLTVHFTDDTTDTITIPRSTVAALPGVTVAEATLTLDATYASRYLRCTNVGGCTVTVPPDVFEVGDEVTIRNSAGADVALTLVAGTGVTLNKPTGYDAALDKNGAVLTLKLVDADTNEWDVFGLLAQSA